MNIKNLKQPIKAIGTQIKNMRIEKHQAEINKYVNITPGQSDEAYKQIITAQEMLANYAKANNVKINIGDCATSKGKLINVEVTTHKYITLGETISADTNRVLQAERSNIRFSENKEGLSYLSNGKFTCEDTFLKNLYRIVSNLTIYIKKM